MKPKFSILDTSGLISLLYIEESKHTDARIISERITVEQWTGILPGEVFTELLNVIGKKKSHQEATFVGKSVRATDDYQLIETTDEIRTRAFQIFQRQTKGVSYTDCLVMAFADYYNTKTIFGFDLVFKKNGYTLPREY